MVIKKKKKQKGIVIDLTGQEGNAFNLLAIASRLAKQLDLEYQKAPLYKYQNLCDKIDRKSLFSFLYIKVLIQVSGAFF